MKFAIIFNFQMCSSRKPSLAQIVSLTTLIVLFGARHVHAADDVEFKQNGEFRARYLNDFNSTALADKSGQNADAVGRLKYTLTARRGENLQAVATAIFASQFGSENSVSADGQSVESNVNSSPSTIQNRLLVNRAWGLWKATNSLTFKVGRFGIELGDGSVFSENEWENIPTFHEGFQIAWDVDFLKVNAFAVKTNEYRLLGGDSANPSGISSTSTGPVVGSPSSDPERNFYLVSADVKNLPEVVKTANVHLMQTNSDAIHDVVGSRGKDSWQHLGLSVSGDSTHFRYRLSGAFQAGKIGISNPASTDASSSEFSAMMIDAMLGYRVPDWLGLKVSIALHRDTGNNGPGKQKQYQPLFYDRHNNAGLMDVVRWGNLSYASMNISMSPKDDFDFGLGLYAFARTEGLSGVSFGPRFTNEFDEAFGADQVRAGGVFNTDSKMIGSEIDLYLDKTYEANFKVGARLSAFVPGNYLKNTNSGGAVPIRSKTRTMSEFMLQAAVVF